ncbi:hypothetical protein Sjap_013307 [Stephania japonica]|uniref:Uncharacterized protein n=1 Tax=Stephania japonica TaxID=461633 RepID=A0AAP0IYV4_9MAGN
MGLHWTYTIEAHYPHFIFFLTETPVTLSSSLPPPIFAGRVLGKPRLMVMAEGIPTVCNLHISRFDGLQWVYTIQKLGDTVWVHQTEEEQLEAIFTVVNLRLKMLHSALIAYISGDLRQSIAWEIMDLHWTYTIEAHYPHFIFFLTATPVTISSSSPPPRFTGRVLDEPRRMVMARGIPTVCNLHISRFGGLQWVYTLQKLGDTVWVHQTEEEQPEAIFTVVNLRLKMLHSALIAYISGNSRQSVACIGLS